MLHQIRDAILSGRIKPREQLPEAALAQTFGTGRSAIREALRQLVQEGLVVSEINRGARVRPITTGDVIFATSTSGLLPSRLCADMDRPERLVVGHPFNPVYLLPLVEVCGGERTRPETVAQAAAIYRSVGMQPLIVRREIDGFVSDRLLEALWREALWLLADDVATIEEIDDAIRYGPGLRWSVMGTFLSYRLAGGEAGMRHFIAQFGPTLKLAWSRLTDVPKLDQPLVDKLVEQSDAQAAGRSIEELELIRDDCLVAVLLGLKGQGFGAGEVIARVERGLIDAAADAVDDRLPAGAPLRLYEAIIEPEWIDYNGHMTESRYLHVLAEATDAFLRRIGIDAAYLAGRNSYFTVETHLRHLGQASAGEPIHVTTQLLGHDEKRLHLFHELRRSESDDLLATGEHMLLHVDTEVGRAAPAGAAVLATLELIAGKPSTTPSAPTLREATAAK